MSRKLKLGLLIGGIVLATGISIYVTVQLIWPMLNGGQEEVAQQVDQTGDNTAQDSSRNKSQNKKEKTQDDVSTEKIGKIYEIDNLTVNTHGSGGLRFAVFKIALETQSSNVISELEQKDPILRDWLIDYYRKKSVGQLLDPQFQDSSKTVIKNSLNNRLSKGRVDSVYYLKLVIQ